MTLRTRALAGALCLIAAVAIAFGVLGAPDHQVAKPTSAPAPSASLASTVADGPMEYAGTVTEAGGDIPLAGTTVELIATSADGTSESAVGSVTASDGSYAVSMDAAFVSANCEDPCTFSVLARRDGYEPVRRTITFADGHHTLDVALPRAG